MNPEEKNQTTRDLLITLRQLVSIQKETLGTLSEPIAGENSQPMGSILDRVNNDLRSLIKDLKRNNEELDKLNNPLTTQHGNIGPKTRPHSTWNVNQA